MAPKLSWYLTNLILVCVCSGVLNAMFKKLQNITLAPGIDGTVHYFHHPVFQTLAMFFGEILCFVIYFVLKVSRTNELDAERAEEYTKDAKELENPWILILPAMLDILSSIMGSVAYILTYASVSLMLRGSGVVFTSLLALIFLKRRFNWNQIVGLMLVTAGVLIAGLSTFYGGKDTINAPNPALGNALTVLARFFESVQNIYEEHLLSEYTVQPLLVVGWEGLFGFVITGLLMIPFYWTPGYAYGDKFEHLPDAFYQIGNSWILGVATTIVVVAITFLMWTGVAITKASGSTARVVAETLRIAFVWVIALAIGWEKFQFLQPIGVFL